jgi:general secretion pathway protein E
MAVQAALTGHLVLSTLHTNDAASAVTRLLDLGVPYFLMQNVLIGVMAQRWCGPCVRIARWGPMESTRLWDALVRPWPLPKPASGSARRRAARNAATPVIWAGSGLYELLTVTPELRRWLRPEVDAAELRRRACEQGMRPLRISAALQIASGLTTFEEIVQVLPPLGEE